MKMFYTYVLSIFFAASFANAQGILIYDQQSATEDQAANGGENGISALYPAYGQSFIPILSSVGFVKLAFNSYWSTASPDTTAYIELWADSIGGTLLGSSMSVNIPSVFGGESGPWAFTNFFFSTPMTVQPGVTYYFQLILTSGGSHIDTLSDSSYSRGELFAYSGQWESAGVSEDLWFQEGTYVVPEPSSAWLILLGSGILFYVRTRKNNLARTELD